MAPGPAPSRNSRGLLPRIYWDDSAVRFLMYILIKDYTHIGASSEDACMLTLMKQSSFLLFCPFASRHCLRSV